MQWETCSERETEAAGARLAARLHPGSVVALYGGLEWEKPRLSAAWPKGWAFRPKYRARPFALVHEYGGHAALVHFDMLPCERVGGSRLHRFL